MGIFNLFRKKDINKQSLKLDDEYNSYIQQDFKTGNKYISLIENFKFRSLIMNSLKLDITNPSSLENVPKSFLDNCLNNDIYLNFLLENSFRIKPEIMNKIINETITFDDLTFDNLFLIDILPSSERISILKNRDLSLNKTEDSYVAIEGNNQLSSDIEEVPVYIDSYFENVAITQRTKKCVKCISLYSDADIKIINKSNSGSEEYIVENSVINDDSIIVLTFEKYKELSKNPELLNILKTHKFYISDDYKENSVIYNLEAELSSSYYDKNYIEIDSMKMNHIVYVIQNSNLSEIEKKYYLYYIDSFSLKTFSQEIVSKIGIDEIKRITDNFNKLDFKLKTKEVEKAVYSMELFNYLNPTFDSLDIEKQINILMHLKNDELTVVLSDDKIQKIFNSEINDYYDLYDYKVLLVRIKNITQNQCVKEFIDRHGLDVNEILQTKEYELKSEYDINPILAKYYITNNSEKGELSIGDIVGFSKYHIKGKNSNMLDNLSAFFDASGDGYHTRSLSLLEFKNGDEALEKLRDSFRIEPLKLEEYDGKYIISGNGLHRTIILRFLYVKELLEGNLSKEELDKKYSIPNCQITKLDYEKTYLNYLLQSLDSSVKGVFNCRINKNGLFYDSDEPKLVVYYSETNKKEMTLDEIKKRIEFLLSNNNNKYLMNELRENYNLYESFKLFMNKYFHNYVNTFNESEEINYGRNI